MNGKLAYLCLGGNMGDVRSAFSAALRRIESEPATASIRAGRLYRTEPWGFAGQPDYLNLAVELRWESDLARLVEFTNRLEKEAGRDRSGELRWGPRPLDIDILIFSDTLIDDGDLQIPHAHMRERRFVLTALADLAPELIPPGWEVTVAEALEACADRGAVMPLTDGHWMDWRES